MKIIENFSLKNLNTFHVEACAKYFCEISSIDQFKNLTKEKIYKESKKLILGGGSNILFASDYDGLVIKNSITGIGIIAEDDETITIKAGAGEVWDDLVSYCVEGNYGGIENLSLIPGTVGAAPIQNIGAYGAEIKNVFCSLEGIFLDDNEVKEFKKDECEFSYRNSIFKKELKGKFLISSVNLKLSKNPKVNVEYASLKEAALKYSESDLTISKVSELVKEIRRSKLPDPNIVGNAGSFFKNPEVSLEEIERIKNIFNDLVFFETGEDKCKIPAGWLIEKCGLKGIKKGNTGTYEKQALVIVNNYNASGKEISQFADFVSEQVFNKFNINLEKEVNII